MTDRICRCTHAVRSHEVRAGGQLGCIIHTCNCIDFEEMPAFIFTFGMGYNLRNNYVKISAPDETAAREIFLAVRQNVGDLPDAGRRWAFTYPADSPRTKEMIERHGLTEVNIHTPITGRD